MSSRGSGGLAQRLISGRLRYGHAEPFGRLKRIVDEDVRLAVDAKADDARDRRVDGFNVRRGGARPRLELERIVKGEVLRLDRSPGERRSRRELRASGDRAARPSAQAISAMARKKRTGNLPVLDRRNVNTWW